MAKTNKTNAQRTTLTVSEEQKGMEMHYATVVGGRKLAEGTQVEVRRVYVNRKFGASITAFCMNGDEKVYIDPKFLKKGKALPAARIAKWQAEDEEQNADVLVMCNVLRVLLNDDDEPKGYFITAPQFAHSIYVPVSDIEIAAKDVEVTGMTVDGVEVNGTFSFYHMPSWYISRKFGGAALHSIRSLADEYNAAIGIKPAKASKLTKGK